MVNIYLLMIVVGTTLVGYYIHYMSKDLSQNTGFLITRYKPFMPFIHILVGGIAGLLINPTNYEWEDGSESQEAVMIRQVVGVFIIVLYTLRNYLKHTQGLLKRLYRCKLQRKYSVWLSSFTRNQAQLLIGLCSSIILVYDGPSRKLSKNIIIDTIVVFHVVLFTLQLVYTYNVPHTLRQKYLKKQCRK